MDQAAAPPANPPPGPATRPEHAKPGLQRLCALDLEARPGHPRHAKLIEGLRRRIQDIERHVPVLAAPRSNQPMPWRLGVPGADAFIGPSGLNTAAVHEIKPGTAGAGSTAASLGFALRLGARRVQQLKAAHPDCGVPRILWCVTRNSARETGELYAPGLAAFGLDPASILIVETARTSEALWAMEEGLKSASLALVIGQPGKIDLTPARRLSLAAEQSSTPCLLLTPGNSPSAAATSTRWRIDAATSAPHPFDARAPGSARITATLERCQHHLGGENLSFVLEWPHGRGEEAHRFSMATALAHRTADAPYARRRTG